MNIKIGDIANIRHFSYNTNCIVRINEINGVNLHMECIENKKDIRINIGDPAVLIFNSESGIIVKGCKVVEVFQDEGRIIISYDENCNGVNKRSFDRYPVSYDSDLKLVSESKRYSTFIKDISQYGFKILTNLEISAGQKIEISPYLNTRIVFVMATIVWGIKRGRYFEYGVSVNNNDVHSIQELSYIIKMTQEEYVEEYITADELKKQQISSFNLVYDSTENKVVFESSKNLNEAAAKLEFLLKRMR